MRISSDLRSVRRSARGYSGSGPEAYAADTRNVVVRTWVVLLRVWHLGFTAFGGPAAQFLIFRRRFVEGSDKWPPWVDEQVYQELFSLCQATPGPASTKLLLCLVWIHAGAIPATVTFFVWSLPTALGMLALALGIQRVNDDLPDIAYAFLSGLNAATVGIIAVAAVQLSAKSIKRRLDRILIIFAGCAGICYSSLWYFPVLIVSGGIVALAWDLFLRDGIVKLRQSWEAKRQAKPAAKQSVAQPTGRSPTEPDETATDVEADGAEVTLDTQGSDEKSDSKRTSLPPSEEQHPSSDSRAPAVEDLTVPSARTDTRTYAVPVWTGVSLLVLFVVSLLAILVIPRVILDPPRPLSVLSNVYLAGTVIFGGGPVLIPLLRSSVVEPGWVSPRDFLIGLAVIQSFPGPNFNFAVYIGALALLNTGYSTILGAFLGFVGIFLPGLAVAIGFMSLWTVLRSKPIVISLLRGFNSAAIGLIFTAVYRLWRIGYLSRGNTSGRSLEEEPWWVVVTTTTYAANAWFKVPIPVAIICGGLLGLCWYGVVK